MEIVLSALQLLFHLPDLDIAGNEKTALFSYQIY